MSDVYMDLIHERDGLLHELNAERAKVIMLEARLDESERTINSLVKRMADAFNMADYWRKMIPAATTYEAIERPRRTLTDRGDAADGYHVEVGES